MLDATHSKVAQSRAVMRVKIKNLRNNKIIEVAFSGNDKIEEAGLRYLTAQFLYRDQAGAHFMDENYEQFLLNDELLGAAGDFLREGVSVDLAIWNGNPLYIKLPAKVELKVTEAAPAVRGDTSVTVNNRPDVAYVVSADKPAWLNTYTTDDGRLIVTGTPPLAAIRTEPYNFTVMARQAATNTEENKEISVLHWQCISKSKQ